MLQPVGDRILVKPLDNQEVTKGGIVLPDSAKEKPQTGTVVAVGIGKYHGEKLETFKDMGIEKGAVIMFKKYGHTEIQIGDEDYFVIESEGILGVISR